jgi:hypothetical protein
VGLGLALVVPGLLFVVLILSIPAILRLRTARAQAQAAAASQGDMMGTVAISLGTVILLGLASFAAFFVTCFAVCLGGVGLNQMSSPRSMVAWLPFIVIASVGSGIVVAVWLVLRLRPRKG